MSREFNAGFLRVKSNRLHAHRFLSLPGRISDKGVRLESMCGREGICKYRDGWMRPYIKGAARGIYVPFHRPCSERRKAELVYGVHVHA